VSPPEESKLELMVAKRRHDTVIGGMAETDFKGPWSKRQQAKTATNQNGMSPSNPKFLTLTQRNYNLKIADPNPISVTCQTWQWAHL